MATSLQHSFPECSICFEHFTTPKVLTCGHTFCLQCIKQYIGEKRVDFQCPICLQSVKIPEGGVENFPTNFIAQTSPTSQSEGKNPTRQESSSQSKVNNSLKKLQLEDTKPTHYCPNHKQRIIDYYCKNCNLGLCAKCVFTHHNDHENIDLERPQTKSTALQDISNCEQFIQNKIQELEKEQASLQELCEKLNYLCEESCSKITKQTDKIIAELKSKCEKTKQEIRENLKQNNKTLNIMADNTKQVDDLKSNLKGELCSMTEDSTLNVIQTLSKLQDLKEQSDNIKIVVSAVRYLEWKESDFKVGENILGSLHPQLLYKPHLLVKSSSQCFIFNCNDIHSDDVRYYSKDKVIDSNVVWSCWVVRYDRKVYVYIAPQEEDNQHLLSIHMTFTITSLNNDIQKAIIEKRDCKFTPGSWSVGYSVIPWDRLVDKTQGFVNYQGQFKIKFEINQVKNLKLK